MSEGNHLVTRPGRLSGKVCVITGSGGSMGRAAAIAFAEEGATLVGVDLDAERDAETRSLVEAAGGRMVCHPPCDLSDPSACQSLVDLAISEFGRIDVVFNNAAGGRFNWVDQLTPDEWRATMTEELDLVFFLCQAAWPHLKVRGGSIINTASMSGKIGYTALPQIAHGTAKAGIIGMTKQLAVEGGPFGIRANSISPGLIATNKTAPLIAKDEWRQTMVSKIILGRPGTPEEIVGAVLFLASDESSFVTGADIAIDGGATAW
ncbi:MAG TPA: SDR family NAD(P)-dependent oxidoreductase [Sphingobium sp.]